MNGMDREPRENERGGWDTTKPCCENSSEAKSSMNSSNFIATCNLSYNTTNELTQNLSCFLIIPSCSLPSSGENCVPRVQKLP